MDSAYTPLSGTQVNNNSIMLSATLLSSNEIVGMGVIEITSVPDISKEKQ